MRLLKLPIRRDLRTSTSRRAKAFRPSLQDNLEVLEERTVLSGAGTAMVAAAATQSPLSITGITVTNLAVNTANTLTATLNVAGTLNTSTGHTPFAIPL